MKQYESKLMRVGEQKMDGKLQYSREQWNMKRSEEVGLCGGADYKKL